MGYFGCRESARVVYIGEKKIEQMSILAIFVYFGRFPTGFGPFRKVQSPSTLETLESATDPAIESYA